MKIVVPVKQVAALDDEFELRDDGRGVDPDFVEWELNEWDTFSLEAALQLARGAPATARWSSSRSATRRPRRACSPAWPRAPTARCASGTTRSRTPTRWRSRARWPPRSSASRPTSCSAACSPPTRSTAPPGVGAGRATSGCRTSRWSSALELRRAAARRPSSASSRAASSRCCGCARPALLTIQTGINEPRYATLRAIKQAQREAARRRRARRPRPRRRRGRGGAGRAPRRLAPPEKGERRRDARGRRRPTSPPRIADDRQGAGERMSGDPGRRRDAPRRAARRSRWS